MFINDNDIEKIKKNKKDKPNNKKEVIKKKDISLDKKNVNLNNIFNNQKNNNITNNDELEKDHEVIDEYKITSDDDFTYQEDKRNIVEKLDYIADNNNKKHPFKMLFNAIKTLVIIGIVALGIYLVFTYTKNRLDVPFSNVGLIQGKEYQLKSLILTDEEIHFEVKPNDIISLDINSGFIKALNKGEVTVNVKVGKDSEKIKVHVVESEVKIENFEINKNIVVDVNKKAIIPITCTPNNTTQLTFNYSSRDTNIATVDENGIITGISTGSTTITVTNNNINRTINVIVK